MLLTIHLMKKEHKIHLSYRFTWINALFTYSISMGFLVYAWFNLIVPDINFLGRPAAEYGSHSFYASCALVSISLLTLVIIRWLGKCPCLNNKHLPMKPKVIYDTETKEKG